MASFVIEGGHRLSGSITPQGAKNEALQVICATLLTSDEVTINNIPDIADVNNLIELISNMGVKVNRLSRHSCVFKAESIIRKPVANLCDKLVSVKFVFA